MAEDAVMEAEVRTSIGTSNCGRLRRAGLLPAVIYGEGKKAEHVQVKAHDLDMILRHHRGSNLLVKIKIGGTETRTVLLKDVQHHPVSGNLVHADFAAINLNVRVKVHVPLQLVGTAPGEAQGGSLEHLLHQIEVSCLPLDIPEQITVDVSKLNIGDHVFVREIPAGDGKYEILTDGDVAVANVAAPRVEEVVAAPVAAEGAEPEVVAKKKADGEAAAPAAGAAAGAKGAAPAAKGKG